MAKLDIKNSVLNKSTLDQFLPQTPTRSQLRRVAILEATITLYAGKRADLTSFEDIAGLCEVTRALVQHYFPTREDLLLMASRYVRAGLQQHLVEQLKTSDNRRDQLGAYVQSHFSWAERHPKHARFWTFFFFLCTNKGPYRELNSEVQDLGHRRITELISLGNQTGEFSCPDAEVHAKLVQTLIVGALVIRLTERSPIDRTALQTKVIEQVFALVGARSG
jgi:AcrR family transcriptional regulator